MIWRHCSTRVAAPVVALQGVPAGCHTPLAIDQSSDTSPKRAAAVASRNPTVLPGWQIVERLSAHVRDHGGCGRGHGGTPFCVAHEGTTGGGGEGAGGIQPPGDAAQRATTATVLMTLVQGSGVEWSTVTLHDVRFKHALDTIEI